MRRLVNYYIKCSLFNFLSCVLSLIYLYELNLIWLFDLYNTFLAFHFWAPLLSYLPVLCCKRTIVLRDVSAYKLLYAIVLVLNYWGRFFSLHRISHFFVCFRFNLFYFLHFFLSITCLVVLEKFHIFGSAYMFHFHIMLYSIHTFWSNVFLFLDLYAFRLKFYSWVGMFFLLVLFYFLLPFIISHYCLVCFPNI